MQVESDNMRLLWSVAIFLVNGFILATYIESNFKFKEKMGRFSLTIILAMLLSLMDALVVYMVMMTPTAKILPLRFLLVTGLSIIFIKAVTYDELAYVGLKMMLFNVLQYAIGLILLLGTTTLLGVEMGEFLERYRILYGIISVLGLGLLYVVLRFTRVFSQPEESYYRGYGGVVLMSNICTVFLFTGMVYVYDYGYNNRDIMKMMIVMAGALLILNIFHFYMYKILEKH